MSVDAAPLQDPSQSQRDRRKDSDSLLEASQNSLVLKTKLKIARNAIRNIKSHMYVHLAVGLGMVFFLLAGGMGIFLFIFDFLMDLEVFGPPLMDRLVGIVFMIFFAMLVFSNLIITLSTTYISKEVDFLMGLPLSRQSIFRQKLIESIIYSSWAFAVLSMPLFFSFGIVRDAPWYFYPAVLALVIPFLIIPATLGAIVTMIVTSLLPARKTRVLTIALGVVSIAGSLVFARVTGLTSLLRTADLDFLQIMNTLAVGNSPLIPSAWLNNAIIALAPADPADLDVRAFGYWWAMLTATALFLMELCRWLVPKLYYRGWCLSRDAAVREVESSAKTSIFHYVDRIMERAFPSSTAGLLSKDLKTFWRDPSQWTQLVLLFGLMVIYVFNLGASRQYSSTLEAVLNDWKLLLTFFNIAATCFILSILTTRFIYPMLSLEGRGFWTVGLAPVPRTRVVWQKYILCNLLCLLVSIPLMLLSNQILQIEGIFIWISLATMVLMSLGLSSLSIGIGAIVPDFKEDNPARIANGIGGTLNVLLSLAYIFVSILAMAIPTIILQGTGFLSEIMLRWIYVYAFLIVIFQLAVVLVPLRIGLRRWERMEF